MKDFSKSQAVMYTGKVIIYRNGIRWICNNRPLTAAIVMTLSVLEGHSTVASLFDCDILYLWHVASSFCICRASCKQYKKYGHIKCSLKIKQAKVIQSSAFWQFVFRQFFKTCYLFCCSRRCLAVSNDWHGKSVSNRWTNSKASSSSWVSKSLTWLSVSRIWQSDV